MTLYLHAATPKSQWRELTTESTFRELHDSLVSEYGRADPSLLKNRLDLNICGAAFRSITGIGALPYGVKLSRRDLIDGWQQWQHAAWPGVGDEWVWASCYGFLRVIGTEGRSARLVV